METITRHIPSIIHQTISNYRRLMVSALWVLTIASAILTYRQVAGTHSVLSPIGGGRVDIVWVLLTINLLLIGGLIAVYARRILLTLATTQQQSQANGLKKRMMLAFGLVAMVPTLVVSILAFSLFNLGLQTWFNERVQTGLSESRVVAEAYFKEHKENLRADALAMASDVSRAGGLSISNPIEFNRFVDKQAELRLLTEVIIFRQNRVIAQGRLSFALAFETFPANHIEQAEHGEIVIFTDEANSKVRALTKIEGIPNAYMVVGRLIDGRVLDHMEETKGAFKEYMDLRERIGEIQFAVSLVFLALALLLLLGALWYALVFASKLTAPISGLAFAAERIRGGDFSARVDVAEGQTKDEVDTLSHAFNRMVEQMESQRGDLITANRNLDERRRFSEAVLSGVSSGVIALNKNLEISLANRSAEKLLLKEGDSFEELVGGRLEDAIPDMAPLLDDLKDDPTKQIRGDIQYNRGEERLTLHARITSETMDDTVVGYIATFDDITPLISAQRQAAWSDVARRIAHEIKNPLTPITLAAERLKRKYGEQLTPDDKENFHKYTDTIEHHVGNIGRIVEEFVQFSRIPTPEFADVEVNNLITKSIFTEKVAHADITYHTDLTDETLVIAGDERLLSQLLVNLFKNAAEAMQDVEHDKEIHIRTELADGRAIITIRDSGKGIPDEQAEKIFEPYVTTREKGTGLGLAISKKIVEDHKGSIKLQNYSGGGALVTLSFAVNDN